MTPSSKGHMNSNSEYPSEESSNLKESLRSRHGPTGKKDPVTDDNMALEGREIEQEPTQGREPAKKGVQNEASVFRKDGAFEQKHMRIKDRY